MKQFVYWATKKGYPDYMEEFILESYEKLNMLVLKNLLDKKGYDRVRESVIDLMERPDFRKTINL